MTKNIIKEVAIMLLVLVAVALLLGILLYDYIPINKTVPIKVEAYKMSSELEEELGTELLEENEKIVKTYTVDSTDLDLYENENDYDAGKKNPFSMIDGGNNVVTNNSNNVNSGNTGSNSNNENNNNNNQDEDIQGNIKTTK